MSEQIEIDKLEPGFKTDRLVADAIKVEYDQEYATGEVYGHQWVATIKKLYPEQGGGGGLRKNGSFCWSFSPSTVIADAFWAASKIRLFDEYIISHRPANQCMSNEYPNGYWWVGEKVSEGQLSDGIVSAYTFDEEFQSDKTLTMAICKATLKLKNASTE